LFATKEMDNTLQHLCDLYREGRASLQVEYDVEIKEEIADTLKKIVKRFNFHNTSHYETISLLIEQEKEVLNTLVDHLFIVGRIIKFCDRHDDIREVTEDGLHSWCYMIQPFSEAYIELYHHVDGKSIAENHLPPIFNRGYFNNPMTQSIHFGNKHQLHIIDATEKTRPLVTGTYPTICATGNHTCIAWDSTGIALAVLVSNSDRYIDGQYHRMYQRDIHIYALVNDVWSCEKKLVLPEDDHSRAFHIQWDLAGDSIATVCRGYDGDDLVMVWCLKSGKVVHTIRKVDFDSTIALGSTFIATVHKKEWDTRHCSRIRIWNRETTTLVTQFEGHFLHSIARASFHPSLPWLMLMDSIGFISIYDFVKGVLVFRLECNYDKRHAIFIDEGKRVVNGCGIWDIDEARQRVTQIANFLKGNPSASLIYKEIEKRLSL
jgi:hypothetical protein